MKLKKYYCPAIQLCRDIYRLSGETFSQWKRRLSTKYPGSLPISHADIESLSVEYEGQYYLCFAGSETEVDWYRNLSYQPKTTEMGELHRGFYEAFKKSQEATRYHYIPKNHAVIVTGHSQGAAIALLWHHYFQCIGRPSRAILFAPPRVYRSINNGIDPNKNVEYLIAAGDIIPHLPLGKAAHVLRMLGRLLALALLKLWLPFPEYSGFQHVGTGIYLSQREVAYLKERRFRRLWDRIRAASRSPHSVDNYLHLVQKHFSCE